MKYCLDNKEKPTKSDLLNSPRPLEPLLCGGWGADRDSAPWLCVAGIPMKDKHPLTLHYIQFVAHRFSNHWLRCMLF